MISTASGGTAERMAARIFFSVLRAGWGTRAMYSSTFFGAPLLFAADLRLRDFGFFILEFLRAALYADYCLVCGSRGLAIAPRRCVGTGRIACATERRRRMTFVKARRRGKGGVCGWSRNSRG